MLTPAQWQAYKNVVNDASDNFNQETVTWYRLRRRFERYGEDDPTTPIHDQISLPCLMSYNVFRVWPMSQETDAGVIDKESLVMMLNRQQMSDLGYLNSDGFFDMDPGEDYFEHMGLTYRSAGETPVSQADDGPLHFYIILSRQSIPTGTQKY